MNKEKYITIYMMDKLFKIILFKNKNKTKPTQPDYISKGGSVVAYVNEIKDPPKEETIKEAEELIVTDF